MNPSSIVCQPHRLRTARSIAGAILLLVMQVSVAHAVDPVYENWRGLAIRGTDPVAYFTEGKPVPGSSDFATEWNGSTWRFASAANRTAFLKEPKRYAPQYGGYCAWAVSQGYTASTDPNAWKIVDAKLYLNYSKEVQKKWAADIPGLVAAADEYWPGLLVD